MRATVCITGNPDVARVGPSPGGEIAGSPTNRTRSAQGALWPDIVSRRPECRRSLRRIHRRCRRRLSDLPGEGIPVKIELHVRRFLCGCQSKAFPAALFRVANGPQGPESFARPRRSDPGAGNRIYAIPEGPPLGNVPCRSSLRLVVLRAFPAASSAMRFMALSL